MQTSWLIESDTFGDDVKGLIQALRDTNTPFKVWSSSIFHDCRPYDIFGPKECVVFYGSLNMAGFIRRETEWVPGLFYPLGKYDYSYYSPRIGPHLLNSNAFLVPYGRLLEQKDWLYSLVGQDKALFIKPNSGNKLFTGKLVYYEYFEKDVDIFSCYGIEPEDLCVVSEPRNITDEWRFVVVDGKIITGSQYKHEHLKDYGRKVDRFCCIDMPAYELADLVVSQNKYNPDRVWTLDICKTKSENFYVLETGCFSCAGLYNPDFYAIIEEVNRVALEEWGEFYG